jgi:RNA polymerase sigma-70 factor (ECF subfamily)
MEPTHSAVKPEELSIFHDPSVETGQVALSGDATLAAVELPEAEQHTPICSPSARVLVLEYGLATEEQLLAAARSADERAFVELSSRHTASVQRKVFRILRNREDAEDAIQDALFKAYTHLGQFRGTCKFSTWLTRIAINAALMQLRRRKSKSEGSSHKRDDHDHSSEILNIADPSPSAEEMYAKRQAIDRLYLEVERLPLSYRMIVNQYHGQERPLQEAADSLGITIAAAKSRLLRARLAIRTALERKHASMADACS